MSEITDEPATAETGPEPAAYAQGLDGDTGGGPVTVQTVYRTTVPAALAAYTAAQDALTAYRQEIGNILDRLGAGHLDRYSTTGHSPGRFAGLARNKTDQEVPAGWRKGRDGYLIPDLRTKAGKAARDALGSLTYPGDPRDSLPGMPSHVLTPGRWLTCGVDQLGDALYVTWSAAAETLGEALGDSADMTVWEHVPLSAYYLAVEQHKAAEAAGAAIFAAGLVSGRFMPGRRKTGAPKPVEAVCGCDHHHSFHDPATGRCAGQVYIDGSRGSYGVARHVQCTCRQYSGPVPMPEYFAPEIASGGAS